MPARNPEAIRQRAIAAAHQRAGQPATPSLDPRFVALNPGALPARERSPAELYQWVRREEQYATLGANVVVELYSESHARKPTTRAWAIIRRAERSHRLASQRQSRTDRHHIDRANRADRTSRSQQPVERGMVADAADPPADLARPTNSRANSGSAPSCVPIWASHGRRRARGPPCTWGLILIRVLHPGLFLQDRTCHLRERCTAGARCEPLGSDGELAAE
jgi:hypothetical protein